MDKQLIRFCQSNNEKFIILDVDERLEIQSIIKEKYVRKDARLKFSIYDTLNFMEASSIDVSDSWKWINDFIQNRTIIVFLNLDIGKDYIKIIHGNIFIKFFDESPLEEFYNTDENTSFLLAYCHSQVLLAMGLAEDWLRHDKRFKDRYPHAN